MRSNSLHFADEVVCSHWLTVIITFWIVEDFLRFAFFIGILQCADFQFTWLLLLNTALILYIFPCRKMDFPRYFPMYGYYQVGLLSENSILKESHRYLNLCWQSHPPLPPKLLIRQLKLLRHQICTCTWFIASSSYSFPIKHFRFKKVIQHLITNALSLRSHLNLMRFYMLTCWIA